jgi:Zn-dependent peptidase ImmA (M78 family)
MTPEDLAHELDISASTMDRLMAGKDGLSFNQLRRIAAFFGRGVFFFLETEPIDEALVHTPQFRTLANQKPELSSKLKALIERVEKQRDIYLSLREDLDDSDSPSFTPPDLGQHEPRAGARIAREWLGLTSQNSFDQYRQALETRGILVFRSNGYSGKWQIPREDPILGFTIYDQVCPVILVKKQTWESQQTFTLMHELGHLLHHKSSYIDDEQDLMSHAGRERYANAFAGHLLVPSSRLRNILDTDRPKDVSQFDQWLEPQRRAWGVSTEVILRRLLDEARLLEREYRAYRTWRSGITVTPTKKGGNREYRHREPRHVFGDSFVRTVFEALGARNVTLAKASSYLDSLKIRDLHKLERYYASL